MKTKKDLRKSIMADLRKLDDNKRKTISKKLQQVLFSSDLWEKSKIIGIYISFETEWDTRNIIEEAFKEGKKVAIPKTIPEVRRLDFYQIRDLSQVEKVKSGQILIEEPIIKESTYLDKNKIDLLIVPGLVFSKDGYRIGFGGGYYDRFLVDFANQSLSLLSEKQLKDSIPINEYDMPVNHLITENGFIK